MPWRPIQSGARGFLSLLGLKNNGRLPEFLAEEVRPVMDMEGWYLRDQMQITTGNGGIGTAATRSGSTPITVPSNEWWYVHDAAAQVTLASGPTAFDLIGFATVASARIGSTFSQPIISAPREPMTLASIVGGVNFVAQPLRDLWLPPGSVIGGYADYSDMQDGVNPPPGILTVSVRYTPVPL